MPNNSHLQNIQILINYLEKLDESELHMYDVWNWDTNTGCAVGHCHRAFPDRVKLNQGNGFTLSIDGDNCTYPEVAMILFGIPNSKVDRVFYVNGTKQEIIANLERLLQG